jgi:hypothetical protein
MVTDDAAEEFGTHRRVTSRRRDLKTRGSAVERAGGIQSGRGAA